MTDEILPSDVGSTERILPTKPISEGEEKLPNASQPFSSFMQQGKGSPLTEAGKTPTISPFDLARGQPSALAQTPNMNTVLAQVNSLESTMSDVKNQMNTPNLRLKSSQKYLLKNKMSDATTSLRAANSKLGSEIPKEPDPKSFSGPLGKFLGYLADGQNQMIAAKQQLQSLKDKGQDLNPGDFLMVQIKLNKAQQELDFSSVLLSNAVSDLKMLMQVQL